MSQIDVNIIEPIPYLQIMEGVGPRGEKGDKGDTGEVTQAEFDELESEVNSMKESLLLAMENIFDIGSFTISVDRTNYSNKLLIQNGSSYSLIYIDYAFTIPPSSLEKSAYISWTVNGTAYSNTVEVSENRAGSYIYGEWSGNGRKANEPIPTDSSTFYLNARSGAMGETLGAIARLIFCDKIHYGVAASGSLTDSFLLSTLTSHVLSETKAITFSVSSGANDYIWVALPTSYGSPRFVAGGFEGGFTSQGSFAHTNNLSYTTNYTLWRSDNKNLGNVTVVVS